MNLIDWAQPSSSLVPWRIVWGHSYPGGWLWAGGLLGLEGWAPSASLSEALYMLRASLSIAANSRRDSSTKEGQELQGILYPSLRSYMASFLLYFIGHWKSFGPKRSGKRLPFDKITPQRECGVGALLQPSLEVPSTCAVEGEKNRYVSMERCLRYTAKWEKLGREKSE